ncbi:MAG: hypothetical protein ACRDSK_13310 [Actinophytocola sp.]|uniref:hypothetical protein n=1 Tax=Actinophytocola sp. TaxID=1872138 RepID=UPI003D6A3A6E
MGSAFFGWLTAISSAVFLTALGAYTEAKVAMFRTADTEFAPWTVVKSARTEAMRSVLSRLA